MFIQSIFLQIYSFVTFKIRILINCPLVNIKTLEMNYTKKCDKVCLNLVLLVLLLVIVELDNNHHVRKSVLVPHMTVRMRNGYEQ